MGSRKGFQVARKRHTVEQIITKLRETEAEIAILEAVGARMLAEDTAATAG
jgi:hypothetical protein